MDEQIQLSERNPFEMYFGMPNRNMPRLISERRTPITIEQRVMEIVGAKFRGDLKVLKSWKVLEPETDAVVLSNPDGREIKIVPRSEIFPNIGPLHEVHKGKLVITPEQYYAEKGKIFLTSDISMNSDGYTPQDAKDHPIWTTLIPNIALREAYIKEVELDNLGKKVMGIRLNHLKGNKFYLAPLIQRGRNSFLGFGEVDCPNGLLIGAYNGGQDTIMRPYSEQTLTIAQAELKRLEGSNNKISGLTQLIASLKRK